RDADIVPLSLISVVLRYLLASWGRKEVRDHLSCLTVHCVWLTLSGWPGLVQRTTGTVVHHSIVQEEYSLDNFYNHRPAGTRSNRSTRHMPDSLQTRTHHQLKQTK